MIMAVHAEHNQDHFWIAIPTPIACHLLCNRIGCSCYIFESNGPKFKFYVSFL